MSGAEPLFMAGAAEAGTTALATEVMGPALAEGVGALGPASLELGGLGGLLGGGVGAAGTGLGAGSLAGGLGSVAPEAFAQTQAAIQAAAPGANQLAPELAGNLGTPAQSAMNVASQNFAPDRFAGAQELFNPETVPAQSAMMQGAAESVPSLTPEQIAQREALYSNAGYGAGAGVNPPSGLDNLFNSLKNGASSVGQWWDKQSTPEKLLYGGAGLLGANALLGKKQGVPNAAPYSGPLSKFHYNPSAYIPYTAQPPANPYRPVYTSYAHGGLADLGGYSDGGRMLKGPGDGMSDDIPATIANKQPARLANEEFVVPADVVSHLGNGSSEAGAKQLYKMMDRVRQARTGNKKQGKQINPEKYLA